MIGVLVADADGYAAAMSEAAVVTSDPGRLVDQAPGCEVLLADPSLAERVIGHLDRLAWVQATWAGVEDLVAAGLPDGVTLTRVEGVFGPQIREFVLCYLLVHERRVFHRLATQRARRWTPADHGVLAGKTLGVMGTGSIGRAVAGAGKCLGMTVVGLSRSGVAADGFDRVFAADRRLEFADGLDHLVVTLPATGDTAGLVDAELLSRVSDEAVLINVGRGSVVDTDAVVAALEAGRLTAAVLDTLPDEPLAEDSQLWDVPNLLITSHTAAPSHADEIAAYFRENLARWKAGEPLRGLVDTERGY